MKVTPIDSLEDFFEQERIARERADSEVLPWQAEIGDGDCFIRVIDIGGGIPLTIYCEVRELTHPEDRALHRQPHMRNYRFCKCYSEACPEGELGDVHVCTAAKVVSKAEFEVLRQLDWPNLVARDEEQNT